MSRSRVQPHAALPATALAVACWRATSPDTCVLVLQVQPNARRTEVVGVQDGALRLKLAAPPVDGQANEALIAWLARELGLAKRALRLRRGAVARHKQVEIDIDAASLKTWLARQPGGS